MSQVVGNRRSNGDEDHLSRVNPSKLVTAVVICHGDGEIHDSHIFHYFRSYMVNLARSPSTSLYERCSLRTDGEQLKSSQQSSS